MLYIHNVVNFEKEETIMNEKVNELKPKIDDKDILSRFYSISNKKNE